MRVSTALIAASLTAFAIFPALSAEGDRYSLERTDDGYVRMDRDTGEMSVCTERDDQLVCRLAVDERNAWEDALDRIQHRLDDVEKRLSSLEGGPGSGLIAEEEFDKALGYMERFFRRFMDIVKDFEKGDAPTRT